MELRVSFLYCVSHGDCAVITFEENGDKKCIVVDGGENDDSAQALRKHLGSEGVETIDLLIGTHIDQDHIQGLNKFVEEEFRREEAGEPHISVGQFWGPAPSESLMSSVTGTVLPEPPTPDGSTEWQRYVIQSVAQNDDLFRSLTRAGVPIFHPARDNPPADPFANVSVEILGPDTQIPANEIKAKALGLTTRASGSTEIRDLDSLRLAVSRNFDLMAMEADRTANNQSIVFRLTPAAGMAAGGESWGFLFAGDAEEEAWETMLGNPNVAVHLAARVLKIPHHGSRNGITATGAQQVSPSYSIVSVGQKHGLPDKEALQRVHSLGSKVLCTRRNSSQANKSDCYNIAAAECPAKAKPRTITFALNTDTGHCEITPASRECGHAW